MTNASDQTLWTGATATPYLIGREDVLTRIERTLASADTAPQLIFITGEGGIGKTRLLREAIERRQSHVPVLMANRLIDLYDIESHSTTNLLDDISFVLSQPAGAFRRYEELKRQLDSAEATGTVSQSSDLRARTFQAFIDDLSALAQDRRVIIALDTAERLIYTEQNNPAENIEIARSWRWLAQQIPSLQNVTWLIAGREQARKLFDPQLKRYGVRWLEIVVEPLMLEQSIAYFDAVARKVQDDDDPDTAALLRSVPLDQRELAHQYSGGRPILLALLVDLLTIQGLEAVSDFIHTESSTDYRMEPGAEAAVIQRLIETPDLGDLLLLVGRLRKGADENLVEAVVTATKSALARRSIGGLLDRLRKLSFVKERGGKLFFHDVMYEMLDEHYYHTSADLPLAKNTLSAIHDYYRVKEKELQREIDTIFAPIETYNRVHQFESIRRELVTHNQARRVLLPELLYYRLNLDPEAGFRRYVRYTFDAILSSDATLDAQLEAEILAFLKERDSGPAPLANRLDRDVVNGIALLRPVARAFADNDQQRAQQEAGKLRQDPRLAIGGPSTEALLNIWQAYSLTYLGELSQAETLLDTAIDILSDVVGQSDSDEPVIWRARTGLAFAYQVRAYLNWSRDELHEAASDGIRAVQLGREVKVLINLATSLNDLGFVLSQLGNIGDGRALINEAIDIRKRIGSRASVAFSHNAAGIVDILEGAYASAVERTTLALLTFRALEHRRGIVLALIGIAEAKRRHSASASVLGKDKIRLLLEASELAQEAVELARENEEPLREIEALIEVGCAVRDRVRLLMLEGSSVENIQRLVRDSGAALERAAALADDVYLYRRADALINLGFLSYYAQDSSGTQDAIGRARSAFPSGYWLRPETGQPGIARSEASALLWTQLAKLHTLHGHTAFDEYKQEQSQEALQQAVEQYLLSLEYNTLYSPDHPGIRIMKDQVFDRLKTVPGRDMREVAKYIKHVEVKYHKQESSQLRELLQNRALWYGK